MHADAPRHRELLPEEDPPAPVDEEDPEDTLPEVELAEEATLTELEPTETEAEEEAIEELMPTEAATEELIPVKFTVG